MEEVVWLGPKNEIPLFTVVCTRGPRVMCRKYTRDIYDHEFHTAVNIWRSKIGGNIHTTSGAWIVREVRIGE